MATPQGEFVTPAEAFKRWMHHENKPPILKDFNPLQLRPGDTVRFGTPTLVKYNFVVSLVDVYVRTIVDKAFKHVDYVLLDDTTTDGQMWVTLRAEPIETKNPEAPVEMRLLVLWQDPSGSMPWSDEMEQVWKEVLPAGALQVKLADDTLAVYNRIGGLTDPYTAEVTEYKTADGAAELPETCSYFDFAREVDGRTEYYILERNEATGMLQGFFGQPVDQADVVMRRALVK